MQVPAGMGYVQLVEASHVARLDCYTKQFSLHSTSTVFINPAIDGTSYKVADASEACAGASWHGVRAVD